MAAVGVRESKSQLDPYLRRVRASERVIVTEHGRPVAAISSPAAPPPDRHLPILLRRDVVRWTGGKPREARRPPSIKGPTIAQAARADRR